MPQAELSVDRFLKETRKDLRLRIVAGQSGLSKVISDEELHRPGLALAGFTSLFPEQRIQILGETEILYLRQQPVEKRTSALETLFSFNIPCLVVTSRNRVPNKMKELAGRYDTPLLTTSLKTTQFFTLLSRFLTQHFAPRINVHGTLVDVWGTGMLLIGRAGIGKSEIAIDLVERGHRFVADDVVTLIKRSSDILIGTGPEMLEHMIEIRGVGVLNIRNLFGVKSVRIQKRVEVILELTDWDEKENYERLGLEEQFSTYMGIKIPLVRLPIFPGKNITVICEAIALNLHLKVYGYNAAKDLSRRLHARIRSRKKLQDYLKDDEE